MLLPRCTRLYNIYYLGQKYIDKMGITAGPRHNGLDGTGYFCSLKRGTVIMKIFVLLLLVTHMHIEKRKQQCQ